MKMMTKRISALLLSLFMVVTLCLPTTTVAKAAATNSAGITSYTAIGDSVSTGYGPLLKETALSPFYFKTGEGAYPRLVKDLLGIEESNYNSLTAVQLSAVDTYYLLGGDWSDEQRATSLDYHKSTYLGMMDEFHNGKAKTYIENSDLITVLIGNIDLAAYPMRKYLASGSSSITDLIGYVDEGKADVKKYVPLILQKLREYNPNARIILLSQYTPYSKVKAPAITLSNLADATIANTYRNRMMSTVTEVNSYMKDWVSKNPSVAEYLDITGLEDYIDEVETQTTSSENFISTCGNHENHPSAMGHEWLRDKIASQLGVSKPAKKAKTDTSTSYLAFSSDTHTSDGEASLKRLDTWLYSVSEKLGGAVFDYMGFTGDLTQHDYSGYSSSKPHTSLYWNKVERLHDTISLNTVVQNGIYTTGNHDYDTAGYWRNVPDSLKNKAPYNYITRLGEAANTNQYQIYCFGVANGSQQFNTEDITALSNYLKTCDKTKPVFVMSHYPLHSYGGRSSTNASQVIEVLNNYPNVIFLWGHNHTLSDTHYSTVYTGSLDGTEIKFTYASAGCMSDSDYSTGSGNIKSKGLVAKMDGSNTVQLTYYNASAKVVSDYDVDISTGTAVKHGDESEKLPAVYPLSSSLEAGKTYVIASEDSVDGASFALNTTSSDGYVTKNNNNTYKYSGLAADEVVVNSKGVTTKLGAANYWTAEAVSGGIALKNVATGKYLNASYSSSVSGYTGVGTLTLEATQDAWTYSSGSMKHKTSSKLLQYQGSGDVDGTKQSGGTDFYTVRTSSKESVYFYTVSDELLEEAGADIPVVADPVYPISSSVEAGKTYVISSTDSVDKNSFAMNATSAEGYITVNNNNKYQYTGLGADAVELNSKGITTKLSGANYWTVESVNGGIAFKNVATGEYLNASYSSSVSGYSGVGTLTLEDTQDAWTYSSGSMKHNKSSKLLQYQGSGDIDGNKQSGGTDFYTVRTSSKESVYFYTVSDELLAEAGTVVPEPEDKEITKATVNTSNGSVVYDFNGEYVIANASNYAINAKTGTGYNDTSSNYRYDGLKSVKVTVSGSKITSKVSDDTIWKITPNEDATGYYIQSADGQYLNDYYTRNAGGAVNTGVRVYLSSTKTSWTITSDGHLKGTSSGKELSYETNSGETEVFTLRSSGNVFSFYKVKRSDDTTCDHQLTKTDAVAATCAATGTEAYWTCSKCNKMFSDAAATKEISAPVVVAKDASNHVGGTEIKNAKDATCTEAGYTGDTYCKSCNAKLTSGSAIAALGHTLVKHAAVAATETKDGNKAYYTCSVCGKYFEEDGKTETTAANVVIPATGHTHSLVKTEAVAATCAATGTEAYWTCSKCNKMYSDAAATKEITAPVVVAKNTSNHVGGTEIKNAKAATCTEAGYTGDTYCKSCNTKLASGSSVAATGHKYNNGLVTKAATCTTEGVKTYTCSVCGATKTEAIAKTAHVYIKHLATAATETEDGCLVHYTCDNCDTYFDADKKETLASAVIIPASGHVHVLVQMDEVPATCTATGTEVYWKCSKCHKLYSDNEGKNILTAPVTIAKNPSNHIGTVEVKNEKAATCTAAGYTGDTYCKGCGVKLASGSAIAATGHKFNNGDVTKVPTCTEDGEVVYTCTVCAATKTEVTAKTGHKLTRHVAVAATETTDGNIEYYTCNVCQKYFLDAQATTETNAAAVVTPALSHVHDTVKVDGKAATCTEAGYKAYYRCKSCDKLFSDKAATKEILVAATIAATGHTFDEGTVTQAPTCATQGVKTYKCTACGATKTEKLDALAHDYSKLVTVPATTLKDGSVNVLCATCGDVLLSEAIYKIDSMKLSYTSCTYSGKYRKPSVTVKDSSGDRIASSNYKVTYTNNKLVGTATVKVIFNGYKYKGTLTKTFKINPKKTSITTLSARSKGFYVKWSKVSAQATGYQIQYATSKTFSNAKTVKVTSYKTTSKTISKLTSKKKYYVRIRTYKTSNKKYYYSGWSAVKYVTTK